MILEEQISRIENQKSFCGFTVKRVNMEIFEVLRNEVIVFEGEDYEVAGFINDSN
ncbi:hypothetical protein [Lederbergia lenta]|uniref:hypothetical protein n=1 Tax=Lederbergia lenta TaxID=1467 RepID=UPI00203B8C69|nr:hypothetical protein [Lederbergia lenta]MCM3109960.1 hypothetical protein [Lederbergia lenta]